MIAVIVDANERKERGVLRDLCGCFRTRRSSR